MSDSTGDRAYARDAGRQGRGAWVGMGFLFLACTAFTVAVVSLASDKSISAIFGIIGVPLFIIGLVLVIVDGRTGGVT